jgi:hypothetical protein
MHGIACAAAAMLVFGYGEASAIAPQTFADVSSGVVLIQSTCHGRQYTGSGFLVGAGVVMTANHVVKGCERVRIHTTDGRWINSRSSTPWTIGVDSHDADIATLRLANSMGGWVFHLRSGQAPVGTDVAVIGHPLGQALAETQGKIVFRSHGQVFARLLGAEGYSGAPFVDNAGNVIAILQEGYGGKDVWGQRTAGAVSGYDFSSRWAAWRHALCKAYPNGGIPDCGATAAPSVRPTGSSITGSMFLGPHWTIGDLNSALTAAMTKAFRGKTFQSGDVRVTSVACGGWAGQQHVFSCGANFVTGKVSGQYQVKVVAVDSRNLTWKTVGAPTCSSLKTYDQTPC